MKQHANRDVEQMIYRLMLEIKRLILPSLCSGLSRVCEARSFMMLKSARILSVRPSRNTNACNISKLFDLKNKHILLHILIHQLCVFLCPEKTKTYKNLLTMKQSLCYLTESHLSSTKKKIMSQFLNHVLCLI